MGLDQCRRRVRDTAGGHVARGEPRGTAAAKGPVPVAGGWRGRIVTGSRAATASAVAVCGSGRCGQNGIDEQRNHQRQAAEPRKVDRGLVGGIRLHGRHHKIHTTMCQLKNAGVHPRAGRAPCRFPLPAKENRAVAILRRRGLFSQFPRCGQLFQPGEVQQVDLLSLDPDQSLGGHFCKNP